MSLESRPTQRVVQILQFLTTHPDRPYGIAELCRSLGLSKSTCTAIVNDLRRFGYVLQDPDTKGYRVGPGLITGGQAMLARFPDVRRGIGALEDVAMRLDLSCSVVGLADQQIIVLHRLGPRNPFHGLTRVGGTIPFIPPWGGSLVAWGEASQLNDWLSRAPVSIDRVHADGLRHSLVVGRRRGFFVVTEPPAGSEERRELTRLRLETLQGEEEAAAIHRIIGRRDYYIDDLESNVEYEVDHLDVPIPAGATDAPISFLTNLFGRPMSGAQINEVARQMAEAAMACGRAIQAVRTTAEPNASVI